MASHHFEPPGKKGLKVKPGGYVAGWLGGWWLGGWWLGAWWLVVGGSGGWWLGASGWWLVAGGWWLVAVVPQDPPTHTLNTGKKEKNSSIFYTGHGV